MSNQNPFDSPAEISKKSIGPVAEVASKINVLLSQGERTFLVPLGLANRVAAGLRATEGGGWKVTVSRCVDTPEAPMASVNQRRLVVVGPDDGIEDEAVAQAAALATV